MKSNTNKAATSFLVFTEQITFSLLILRPGGAQSFHCYIWTKVALTCSQSGDLDPGICVYVNTSIVVG